jgi:hypothetical protein
VLLGDDKVGFRQTLNTDLAGRVFSTNREDADGASESVNEIISMPVASAKGVDLPVSGDTGQDQVLERRRDELRLSLFVFNDDKEVHRPDLGQVVLRAM